MLTLSLTLIAPGVVAQEQDAPRNDINDLPPSAELLQFLGRFEDVDGEFVDPLDFDSQGAGALMETDSSSTQNEAKSSDDHRDPEGKDD